MRAFATAVIRFKEHKFLLRRRHDPRYAESTRTGMPAGVTA